MSELGDLLIKLRGKESQRKAAERIGISNTYLRILEMGYDPRSGKQASPTPDTLKLISDAYNYPYPRLLEISGFIDTELEKELFTEEILKLAKVIINLPDNQRKLIEEMIKTLQKSNDRE
jgi:transcriptional regulator with XRE-family HTH domain